MGAQAKATEEVGEVSEHTVHHSLLCMCIAADCGQSAPANQCPLPTAPTI